ncbi:histidine kinase dimerization/phospho-acceptor domain-containing protein [Mucilaginibacter sp. dw_454]|uniref:histidine kinase dimerization/phospho-acceptor domain-containing protein n=1 Tax=Mucilaginibacter sp. dw_454 TaxID=2720079 RepID=UPI001BD3FB51|nr:histidine kinase dimerization/phospho-acceptor domain-containing protein [Mucilaginibacter sp. dw_454]
MDEEAMAKLSHDIKNQLSNIHLALDTLKHEVPEPTEDFLFCLESILTSATKINELLNHAR